MYKKVIIIIIGAVFFATIQAKAYSPVSASVTDKKVLSKHIMPLDDRYPNKSVSDVFKDNILLTNAYLFGKKSQNSGVNWNEVRKPSQYEFVLKPGDVFAFHEDVLPQYQGKNIVTTHAHFDQSQGFVSDGYLTGDGVCHLASLLNWVARDAGLTVLAPTNHDFANIPDIPKQYGTAIYYMPGENASNERQNLYITNNLKHPVRFLFKYANDILTVTAVEA